MTYSYRTPSILVVEEGDDALAAFSGCIVIAMGIIGCPEAWVGIVIGCAVAVSIFLIMRTREEFVFDQGKRTVSWMRGKTIRSQRGVVSFDEISDVRVNVETRPHHAHAVYRVELVTARGTIPVRRNFGYDKEKCEEVAATIKSVLWTLLGKPEEKGSVL